jgi:hypothetical protein
VAWFARCTSALGDGLFHDNVAIENASDGIGHRLVVVVSVHQNAENTCDRTLLGAGPGPLE